MHASTRILLWLVVIIAIIGGWALLFAINDLLPAIIYAVIWAAILLIVGRVLLAVGLGYNRLTVGRVAGQAGGGPADSATALSELAKMRDQGLISTEEYEAKRSKILERL